jgi:DNA-binding beta-propeller fold protein YncE
MRTACLPLRRACVAAALLATLVLAIAHAAAARAEACPGSGATAPCPYAVSEIIGRRAEGVLRFPEAVAVDSQGDVYVADQLTFVVQKFNDEGVFEGEWGSYGGGPGQFGPIGALATDAAGNVYVVDSSHNRIQKFSPNGELLAMWGHKGSALGDFNFGSSQDYTKPPGGGIAVGGSYVYVADSVNDRIERFNLSGGEPIQWGSYGGGPGQFSYPRGVAANESEVLVTDDNQRVQRFDTSGDYLGSAGSAGTGPGQFQFTYGVALDAVGDVFVADDLGHRIVKLGTQLQFLGAWGGFGSKPGQLAFPRALASDPAGDTYVADTANDRVEVFGPNGGFLRTIGISGRAPGQLTSPRGLAVDPAGRLLASDGDGNRVEIFQPHSELLTALWSAAGGNRPSLFAPAGIAVDPAGTVYVSDDNGTRLVRYWGDGTYLGEIGGPNQLGGAQLNAAGSLAVAPPSHTLYVADSGHNRILSYSPTGTLIARWGAGEGDGAGGSGEGQFLHPDAVATNAAGDVYVADTGNNRIVELSPAGAVLAQWGSRGTGDGHFRSPTGVAVDAAGTVYVVDSENNRVQAFAGDGALVAPVGVGALIAKWGLRGTGYGEFSQPSAVAVGCEGDVYVADTNNNRVERFEPLAPAGYGCAPLAAWPPPLNVAPVLHVSLPRSGGVLARRALALSVSCQRGCKLLVTATLAPLGRRGGVPLVATTRSLPRGLSGHLRLRLGGSALARLRRALGAKRLLSARVMLVAAGPTGLRTTVVRRYTVSR